jgi:protein-S-isoprenylcysteine O-methyltransferase Ste14
MTAYGLWTLVAVNSLIFIIFAFSFTRPKSGRDWRSFGAFSAFVVALFTEMYGFPLTIYLLSGWLGNLYPGVNLFSHDAGHIWYTVFGLSGDPHNNIVHEISNWLITGGMVLLGISWRYLYRAQRSHTVATSGPYSFVRHPQYIAFITVLLGFLLQWPTILTVAMFPVLLVMYAKLACLEEKEALKEFGDEYARYAAVTPRFFPRLGHRASQGRA